MDDDTPLERFRDLKERYDAKHGRGAVLDVKDELGLGSGTFDDQLSTEELERLNAELACCLSGAK